MIEVKAMNIGVLDDDIFWQNKLSKLLLQYQFELDIDYNINIYSHEEEIKKDIDKLDLLFMDIDINHQNGISLTKKIVNQNKDIIIIYVTSFAHFMPDAFHLNVYKYILKTDLSPIKECILFAYRHFQSTSIVFKTPIGERPIDYNDIVYIESDYGKIFVYTKDEEILIQTSSLKDLNKKLPNHFVLINKQNIINLDKIVLYNQNQVTLQGESHPLIISRRKMKDVKDKYIMYMMNKEIV